MPAPWMTALALAVPLLGLLLPAVGQAQDQTPAAAALIGMTIPSDIEKRQISVVVAPGLTRTKDLPTEALRLIRKAMLEDQPVTDADLRALADQGDGLAAQKYVSRLMLQGGASPSDIAYYATVAISTGRVWTLPEAVDAMRLLDPETEPAARKKAYVAMLYPHAWAGNSLALDAVIDLNGEGKLFGPLSEATRQRILEQGDKNGDGRAALRLALILLQKPELTADDQATLQDYLNRAKAVENLAVRTTALNLLALQEGKASEAALNQ